ncbi:Cytochrome c oxidase aa3, subunit II [Candidatus Thiomargarita nelsonii]|uniref:Cytochrome aa3 subunit 2 n=1 Tax=Candidatus Thiomargarita nelsonii TaxID=1003181 RepID=A0A176S308_9GAMM|nr:Cytochrome c oxidase aa3, subunit II [Candidatus Thiomargarita nelsonii]
MLNRKPLLDKGLYAGITSFMLLFAGQAKSAAEQQINDPAPAWDHLWHEVIVDITIIGVIFSLVTLYFIWKYRRRAPDQEGSQPKLSAAMAVGWALIPAFIFMADDFFLAAKGWQLWNAYRQVPADRLEIKLESGMYSWDYTYPNGVETQNELRVPAGKPILLRMTSRDTLHSHYIPDFRVKEDSMPGRVTYLWFYPKAEGEHIVTCTEYCGIMHSYMVGKVIAMPADQFNQWYEQEGIKQAKKEAENKVVTTDAEKEGDA